jgi:hypothetical protein
LGKLRQQEITNEQTNAGLGIKQSTLANTVANDQATQKVNQGKLQVAGQNANTSARNSAFNTNPGAVGSPAWQRVQSSSGTAWSTNPNAVGSPAWARVQAANARTGAGAKPLTTISNNTWLGKLGTVQQLIQDGQKNKLSEAQIKANLTDGQNPRKTPYDQTMVEAAYELLGWGHITPETAAAMHQMGVRGGTFRGAPIQVAPAPAAAGGLPIPGGLAGAVPGIGNTIAGSVPSIS